MTPRPAPLREALDAALAALALRARDDASRLCVARVAEALAMPAPGPGAIPSRLTVCGLLPEAAAPALADPALRPLADALLALDPQLPWRRRGGEAPGASEGFAEGHANAMIAGPGGLEQRQDAWLGVSLLAPHVRYPDHDHAPEETYLVLSDGEFRQGEGAWFAPGLGGSFHNPPGIRHAMRAGAKPLLALWALWAPRAA